MNTFLLLHLPSSSQSSTIRFSTPPLNSTEIKLSKVFSLFPTHMIISLCLSGLTSQQHSAWLSTPSFLKYSHLLISPDLPSISLAIPFQSLLLLLSPLSNHWNVKSYPWSSFLFIHSPKWTHLHLGFKYNLYDNDNDLLVLTSQFSSKFTI